MLLSPLLITTVRMWCLGVLGTSGQTMVTEMGCRWLADISRYIREHGHENILPLSRLHAEASSDQANLLMLAHQPSQMCYGTSENHGCDIDEQRSHTSQPRLMPRLDSGTSDAESESRNNLPASDIKGRIQSANVRIVYESLQRVPTENNQRCQSCTKRATAPHAVHTPHYTATRPPHRPKDPSQHWPLPACARWAHPACHHA